MYGLSARSQYGLFSLILICLSFPAVGLTAESGSLSGLRSRVEVLLQARNEASAELEDKVRQGSVTERDRQHYQTVTTFLAQQLADSCRELIDRGGASAVAGLSCPDDLTGLKKIEAKKPGKTGQNRTAEKKQQKERQPETAIKSPVQVPSPEMPSEAAAVKNEETAQAAVVKQPPATGVFAAIRRWWESLFAPKPPPASSGTEQGSPRQQKEKNAAGEQKNQQQTVSAGTAKMEPGDASGNKKPGASSDKPAKVSAASGAMKKASAEKKEPGGAPSQQPTEEKNKQAADNGLKVTAAGPAGGEQERQGPDGRETGRKPPVQGGAAEKAAHAEKGGSDEQKEKGKNSSSPTAQRRTGDVERGGKNKGQDKEVGTARQVSVKPVHQAGTGKSNSRSAAGGTGSGKEKNEGRGLQPGTASRPPATTALAGLDKSLSDALGEFDGKLLQEQERLAARVPKQREGGGTGYGADGPPGPAGSGGISGPGYGGQEGDSRAGAGGYEQPGSVVSGGGKPAPDSGRSTIDSDDDIVARQLREAAEKETDPALKEKLWQEYRKYKEGSR